MLFLLGLLVVVLVLFLVVRAIRRSGTDYSAPLDTDYVAPPVFGGVSSYTPSSSSESSSSYTPPSYSPSSDSGSSSSSDSGSSSSDSGGSYGGGDFGGGGASGDY
jgi:uncharacterized membrane protein YgcG